MVAAQEADKAEAAEAQDEDDSAEEGGEEEDDDDDDDDDNDDDDDEEEEDEEEDASAAKEKAAKAYSESVAKAATATQELEEANRFDGMPVFTEKDRTLRDQVRGCVEALVDDDPDTQRLR